MSTGKEARLPTHFENVVQLEELLSEPSEWAIESMGRLDGDLLMLGAGGKMGPTLARMARRASDAAGVRRRVIAVSRFSNSSTENELRRIGVETLRCDLLNRAEFERLPRVPNVLFMVGAKFGSQGNEPRTWMTNVFLPGKVCEHFRESRIVVFSTGNVYGLTPHAGGGSRETDPLQPVGEYAMSALGRERIVHYSSQAYDIPVAVLRLNYAHEMRYGVMVDLAKAIWNEQPVDLTMGYFNALWQGDGNAMSLAAFDHLASPPRVINLAGLDLLEVRQVAEQFASLLNKRVHYVGSEAPDALLSNGELGYQLCGAPRVSARQMIEWIAAWVQSGGVYLDRPTHFEVRDGVY
jgi:nucleoside-diphosphate-sugar epimerase